jgi:type IV secretion system protein VirD4
MKGKIIIGQNACYDTDISKNGQNNNVLVVGATGTGKTVSIVTPNLLNEDGSYILCDPKGSLYGKYAERMRRDGYAVKRVSFIRPELSSHYNPLAYISGEEDIAKMAHAIVYSDVKEGKGHLADPFWDQTAEILLTALIGYLAEFCPKADQNLKNVCKLLRAAENSQDNCGSESTLDRVFAEAKKRSERTGKDSYAVRQYEQYRLAADRTLRSIQISLAALVARFDVEPLRSMMEYDEIDFASAGRKRTVIFTEISDCDRSMDVIANLFFSQAVRELMRYADTKCSGFKLPVPVKFILDDFATNVTIGDFPRMISSFRSRQISVMIMIQAESQLAARYGEEAETVISNCDTYVYLGSNDIRQASCIATRADCPVKDILEMKCGDMWVFRRGESPLFTKRMELGTCYREGGRTEGAGPEIESA